MSKYKLEEERALKALRMRIAQEHYRGSAESEAEARRDYTASKLASYVAAVVADAPELTTEQAERIAALLRPSAVA